MLIHRRGSEAYSSLPEFDDLTPIELEGDGFFISSISKIGFTSGKAFILDRRQKKIFVFNDQMEFAYSIGNPGQGPGDLSQPEDLAVGEESIYVLDEIAKRIDTFSLSGTFIARTSLAIPPDIFYSHPSAILTDGLGKVYVAYSLSDHILDVYGTNGSYLGTHLEREDPVILYKKNIGNSSTLGWTPHKTVMHFNTFSGRFVEVFPDGNVGRQFGIKDPRLSKMAQDIQNDLAKDRSGAIQTDVISFLFYTNFCIDDEGYIYVCQRRIESGEKQRIWRIAPGGRVSSSEIPLSGDVRIKALYYNKGRFYFVSDEERLYITKRRKP